MATETTRSARSITAGILIIAAYSMLTYDITGRQILGTAMDVLSGLAVIGIALLMRPLFAADESRALRYGYMASRMIEGLLMIFTGIWILIPPLAGFRAFSYQYVHIYFFLAGALFFNLLLFRRRLVPRFISIWGLAATVILLAVTLLKLAGLSDPWLDILLAPMILNELFLAFWLMIRGFDGVRTPASSPREARP